MTRHGAALVVPGYVLVFGLLGGVFQNDALARHFFVATLLGL
jgi:hypothetical protein